MGFFELMAECSVALGGFAAVHAALRGSTGPRGFYRAWGTVSWAFTALLMALVPPLFATVRELDGDSWRLIHVFGLVPAAASMATSLWVDVQLNAWGYRAQVVVFLRAAQALGLLGCVVLLCAVLGWPTKASPATYAIAVWALFVPGVIGITASFWIALRESIESQED